MEDTIYRTFGRQVRSYRALSFSASELLAETADLTSDTDRPYVSQFARLISKKTSKQKDALIWLVKDAVDLIGK